MCFLAGTVTASCGVHPIPSLDFILYALIPERVAHSVVPSVTPPTVMDLGGDFGLPAIAYLLLVVRQLARYGAAEEFLKSNTQPTGN